MTEKYAWMMESTFPEEFQRIAGQLPGIDEASIDCIVASRRQWAIPPDTLGDVLLDARERLSVLLNTQD